MVKFFLALVALAPVVFLVGLVKPKWVLFWMKEPDRLWSTTMGLLLFVAGWTGYSELTLKPKLAEQRAQEQTQHHKNDRQRSPEQENELKLDRY